MAESEQEKTEDASERRIQQFRDEGKVAQSKELSAAIGLTVGAGTLLAAFPMMSDGFAALFDALNERISDHELTQEDVSSLALTIAMNIGPPLMLVLAASAFSTLIAGLLVSGFNVAPAALEVKFERLDPLQNAKSHFLSVQPVVALIKGIAVASAVSWAAWSAIETRMDALPVIASVDVRGQLEFMTELIQSFFQRVLPVALAVGAADYGWQRYQLSEQMRMTKEEVKQEHKEQEGNPQVKAKRRQRQRQLAMGQMLRKVQEADVVVVNPTHYAIALRYRKGEGGAPIVLARGVDHLALKIRAEANRHEVPIIENRALARAMYAKSRLGFPIPAEFYGAVAQVLAVVYRRRAQAHAAGAS